jgi:hypothetical protein
MADGNPVLMPRRRRWIEVADNVRREYEWASSLSDCRLQVHSESLVVNPELVVNVSLQRLFDRHKPVQIVRVIQCFLESGDTKNRDTEFGIEEAL